MAVPQRNSAGGYDVPHVFSSGRDNTYEQLNENFAALFAITSDQERRLAELEAKTKTGG